MNNDALRNIRMVDIEKVTKGLECCKRESENIDDNPCDDCPYYDDRCYHDEMIRDALELLKEQEHKDRMYHALEDDWKRLKELLKEQETELCDRCGRRRVKSNREVK